MTSRVLSQRVGKLEEATASKLPGHFCLVVHNENCHEARAQAIAEFVALHGHEPHDFINILLISPETKRSICGCALGEIGFQ